MNGARTRMELDQRALERAQAMKRAVYEQIPGAVTLIKDLIAAGFEISWRSVVYVGPERTAGTITADKIDLRTRESTQ